MKPLVRHHRRATGLWRFLLAAPPRPVVAASAASSPAKRAGLLGMLAILALAAACAGGSGSSGFDISPSAEQAAIAAALEESRCVESGALTMCPADEIPRDIPSNLPGSTRIDTGVAGSESLACLPSDAAAGCDVSVPFAPQGFPAGTDFRIAVRDPDDGSQWNIGAEAQRQGSPDAPSFDATVPVGPPGGQASPPDDVQLVVLVFLEPPPEVPTTVELLADSGADFAFVTPEIALTAPGL